MSSLSAEECLDHWTKKKKLILKLNNKWDYFYPRGEEVESLVSMAVKKAREENKYGYFESGDFFCQQSGWSVSPLNKEKKISSELHLAIPKNWKPVLVTTNTDNSTGVHLSFMRCLKKDLKLVDERNIEEAEARVRRETLKDFEPKIRLSTAKEIFEELEQRHIRYTKGWQNSEFLRLRLKFYGEIKKRFLSGGKK